jgi:RNA polymerase sigma-70 factor (ECF subfamily)
MPILRQADRITVSCREGFAGKGAGMKRASAGTAPLRNGFGSATKRAVHAGLPPDDAALLSKLRLGSPAAVDALFDRYHGKVYGLAMSILKNKCDAEEAAQDVFLTVVRKADRFQGNSDLSSWIYRICVNACLMRLRKDQRTETVPIEEFLPVFTKGGAHAGPVEDWSREVDRGVPDKELGRAIGGFTGELPEKYRVVFALCDVQGFSYEETAQVLDLTISSVKSRLHRARLYLRERLSRYLRDGRVV